MYPWARFVYKLPLLLSLVSLVVGFYQSIQLVFQQIPVEIVVAISSLLFSSFVSYYFNNKLVLHADQSLLFVVGFLIIGVMTGGILFGYVTSQGIAIQPHYVLYYLYCLLLATSSVTISVLLFYKSNTHGSWYILLTLVYCTLLITEYSRSSKQNLAYIQAAYYAALRVLMFLADKK